MISLPARRSLYVKLLADSIMVIMFESGGFHCIHFVFFSYQAKDVAAVASWKSLVSVQLDTLLRDNADLRSVEIFV